MASSSSSSPSSSCSSSSSCPSSRKDLVQPNGSVGERADDNVGITGATCIKSPAVSAISENSDAASPATAISAFEHGASLNNRNNAKPDSVLSPTEHLQANPAGVYAQVVSLSAEVRGAHAEGIHLFESPEVNHFYAEEAASDSRPRLPEYEPLSAEANFV